MPSATGGYRGTTDYTRSDYVPGTSSTGQSVAASDPATVAAQNYADQQAALARGQAQAQTSSTADATAGTTEVAPPPSVPPADTGGGSIDAVVNTPEEKKYVPGDNGAEIKDYGPGDEAQMNEKAAQIASMTQGGAVNSAMQAAMAAGMSPSQAAFAASRAGSNAYQSAFPAEYNALKQMGLNEQEIANTFSTTNKGLGIEQQSVNNVYDLGKKGLLNQQTQQTMGGLGGLLSVIAAGLPLLSDEKFKEDVEPAWGMLGKVASEVKPYYYKYTKEGTALGGRSGERAGVMAQDLERTPLKSTVVNTPQGKMIDTPALTTANTAMISELSNKLDKAMAYLTKGGK